MNLGQSDSRGKVVKSVDKLYLNFLICKMGMIEVTTAWVVRHIRLFKTGSGTEHSRYAGHSDSTFYPSAVNISIIKAMTELRAEGYGSPEKQTSSLMIWGDCQVRCEKSKKCVIHACIYLLKHMCLPSVCKHYLVAKFETRNLGTNLKHLSYKLSAMKCTESKCSV